MNTFDIIKHDGTKEEMQIIASYEKNGKHYIIYKDLNKNPKFYGASYTNQSGTYANLNTNLTDEEKKFMNEVFKKISSNAK